ncbi:4143_t:CDS:2, partial [Acaulospora colombiana]
KALYHAEAILAATPPDHPLYEMYKSIHSYALLAAPNEESPVSHDEIINHAREEVERAKAARDPNWGRKVLRLCNLLYARFEKNLEARDDNISGQKRLTDDLDLEHAFTDWKKVATAGLRSIPSPPSVRFRAALKWADVACREGRYKSAVEAYKVAMSLAPRVSLARRRGALSDDSTSAVEAAPGEENELALHAFSLASDAAAAAIEKGSIDSAIEFLEQARSLLWRDALALPTDLESLEQINPELANHLVEVLIEQEQHHPSDDTGPIVSPTSPLLKPSSLKAPWMTAAEEKTRLEGTPDDRWNSIVGTVRAAEAGFSNFMRPWSLESLRAEDAHVPVGPVVILNSSYIRCDAIVLVSTSEPVLVPLEAVTKGELERLAAQLVTGVRQLGEGTVTGFEFDKAVLEPVLKTLWEKVVSPVLEKLEEVAVGRNVGWIPTGAFTWLPVHAASLVAREAIVRERDDRTEEEEGIRHTRIDYASKYTSYYATSLQSLLRPPVSHGGPSNMLIISDQPARRAPLLGGVVTSIQALRAQLGSKSDDGRDKQGQKMVNLQSFEGPGSAVPGAIIRALQPPTRADNESDDAHDANNAVDAIHFSCSTFCDALRPSNSSWRVADGGVVRVSDLFGPTRAGGPSEGKLRLPQELMSPEAALQFAGVRSVIGQIWNTK